MCLCGLFLFSLVYKYSYPMIFLVDEVILYFSASFNCCSLKLPLLGQLSLGLQCCVFTKQKQWESCVRGAKDHAAEKARGQKGGHCRWHSDAATSRRRESEQSSSWLLQLLLNSTWEVLGGWNTLCSVVSPHDPAWCFKGDRCCQMLVLS